MIYTFYVANLGENCIIDTIIKYKDEFELMKISLKAFNGG